MRARDVRRHEQGVEDGEGEVAERRPRPAPGAGTRRDRAALDHDLGPLGEPGACDRPGRQLEHALRVRHPRRDAPRGELGEGAHHALVLVQEDGIHGVAHAEHVDLAAGPEPEAVAGIQALGAEEAPEPRPVRVREAQPLSEYGPAARDARAVHGSAHPRPGRALSD